MPKGEVGSKRLAGKVALVTGAGSTGAPCEGIGQAIALAMAEEGAQVAVADLDEGRARVTANQIEAAGGEALVAVGDVSDPATCERVVAETVARFGGLDALVNNVGVSDIKPLATADFENWDRIMAVNLRSAAAMSAHAIPRLEARGGGSITMIGSVAGMQGDHADVYGAAKAGMHSLARDITLSHGRKGVRCNVVAPGHLYTAHLAHRLTDAQRELRRRAAPLGIEGDAWDIAHLCAFLASEQARMITAQLIAVDGGVTEMGALSIHQLLTEEDRGEQ